MLKQLLLVIAAEALAMSPRNQWPLHDSAAEAAAGHKHHSQSLVKPSRPQLEKDPHGAQHNVKSVASWIASSTHTFKMAEHVLKLSADGSNATSHEPDVQALLDKIEKYVEELNTAKAELALRHSLTTATSATPSTPDINSSPFDIPAPPTDDDKWDDNEPNEAKGDNETLPHQWSKEAYDQRRVVAETIREANEHTKVMLKIRDRLEAALDAIRPSHPRGFPVCIPGCAEKQCQQMDFVSLVNSKPGDLLPACKRYEIVERKKTGHVTTHSKAKDLKLVQPFSGVSGNMLNTYLLSFNGLDADGKLLPLAPRVHVLHQESPMSFGQFSRMESDVPWSTAVDKAATEAHIRGLSCDFNHKWTFKGTNPTFWRGGIVTRYTNAHQCVGYETSTRYRASLLIFSDMEFKNVTLPGMLNIPPTEGPCYKGLEDPTPFGDDLLCSVLVPTGINDSEEKMCAVRMARVGANGIKMMKSPLDAMFEKNWVHLEGEYLVYKLFDSGRRTSFMHCGDDECFVSHHVAWAKPALMVAGDEVQIDGYEVVHLRTGKRLNRTDGLYDLSIDERLIRQQLPDDLSLHAGATITLHGGVTFINPSIDDFFKRNKLSSSTNWIKVVSEKGTRYLSIIHQRLTPLDHTVLEVSYLSRFLSIDKETLTLKISEPSIFKQFDVSVNRNGRIEFASGLKWNPEQPDTVWVAYGSADCHASVVDVSVSLWDSITTEVVMQAERLELTPRAYNETLPTFPLAAIGRDLLPTRPGDLDDNEPGLYMRCAEGSGSDEVTVIGKMKKNQELAEAEFDNMPRPLISPGNLPSLKDEPPAGLVDAVHVLSLWDGKKFGHYDETKERLLSAGVPERIIRPFPACDGDAQERTDNPEMTDYAATLGVLPPNNKLAMNGRGQMRFPSGGWHQFGISVSHTSAWDQIYRANKTGWSLVLEEDANLAEVPWGTWFDLLQKVLKRAPADADYIWLGTQQESINLAVNGYVANSGTDLHTQNAMNATMPLLCRATSLCPHTTAITAKGAAKLLHGARDSLVQEAIDIWQHNDAYHYANTYVVNEFRAMKEGLMKPPPADDYPRSGGIAFQHDWKEPQDKHPVRVLKTPNFNDYPACLGQPKVALQGSPDACAAAILIGDTKLKESSAVAQRIPRSADEVGMNQFSVAWNKSEALHPPNLRFESAERVNSVFVIAPASSPHINKMDDFSVKQDNYMKIGNMDPDRGLEAPASACPAIDCVSCKSAEELSECLYVVPMTRFEYEDPNDLKTHLKIWDSLVEENLGGGYTVVYSGDQNSRVGNIIDNLAASIEGHASYDLIVTNLTATGSIVSPSSSYAISPKGAVLLGYAARRSLAVAPTKTLNSFLATTAGNFISIWNHMGAFTAVQPTPPQVDSVFVVAVDKKAFRRAAARLNAAGVPMQLIAPAPAFDGHIAELDSGMQREGLRHGVMTSPRWLPGNPDNLIENATSRWKGNSAECDFDPESEASDYGREWEKFGTSVAHLQALERIALRGDVGYSLVLDADAVLANASKDTTWFEMVQHVLKRSPYDADFIALSHDKQSFSCGQKAFPTRDGSCPLVMHGSGYKTHSYAVSRRGAALLHAASRHLTTNSFDVLVGCHGKDVVSMYLLNHLRAIKEMGLNDEFYLAPEFYNNGMGGIVGKKWESKAAIKAKALADEGQKSADELKWATGDKDSWGKRVEAIKHKDER